MGSAEPPSFLGLSERVHCEVALCEEGGSSCMQLNRCSVGSAVDTVIACLPKVGQWGLSLAEEFRGQHTAVNISARVNAGATVATPRKRKWTPKNESSVCWWVIWWLPVQIRPSLKRLPSASSEHFNNPQEKLPLLYIMQLPIMSMTRSASQKIQKTMHSKSVQLN